MIKKKTLEVEREKSYSKKHRHTCTGFCIFLHKCGWFKSLRSISRGRWWKEAAFPSPLVWPSFYHSSLDPSIPFLCHCFQMFPKLAFVHGRPMSCFGIMAECHFLLSFYILFFGLLVRYQCECVCSVYVSVYWILITPLSENIVTTPTAPTPPRSGIWEEHRTRVRRLPSSHLWALTLPEKQTLAQTHSQHMQCLAPLSYLHMSPSSSLIHRHTVELFKSIRLVSH